MVFWVVAVVFYVSGPCIVFFNFLWPSHLAAILSVTWFVITHLWPISRFLSICKCWCTQLKTVAPHSQNSTCTADTAINIHCKRTVSQHAADVNGLFEEHWPHSGLVVRAYNGHYWGQRTQTEKKNKARVRKRVFIVWFHAWLREDTWYQLSVSHNLSVFITFGLSLHHLCVLAFSEIQRKTRNLSCFQGFS